MKVTEPLLRSSLSLSQGRSAGLGFLQFPPLQICRSQKRRTQIPNRLEASLAPLWSSSVVWPLCVHRGKRVDRSPKPSALPRLSNVRQLRGASEAFTGSGFSSTFGFAVVFAEATVLIPFLCLLSYSLKSKPLLKAQCTCENRANNICSRPVLAEAKRGAWTKSTFYSYRSGPFRDRIRSSGCSRRSSSSSSSSSGFCSGIRNSRGCLGHRSTPSPQNHSIPLHCRTIGRLLGCT